MKTAEMITHRVLNIKLLIHFNIGRKINFSILLGVICCKTLQKMAVSCQGDGGYDN